MDLHRLHAIQKQWSRFPPVHIAVGCYLGFGKKAAEQPSFEDGDSMMSAIAGEFR
jgi:hypothetical protein